MDTDEPWSRTVLAGLAALAAAALVIGIVFAVVAVGAVRMAGLSDASGDTSTPERLVVPRYVTPTETEEVAPPPYTPKVSVVPLDPTDGPSSPVGDITLFASASSVSAGEKINLNGVYLDGEGVALQVQRRDGAAWVDFPVKAKVQGGGFETFVYTGRAGVNVFRVFDPTTGRSSNPVSVTVG